MAEAQTWRVVLASGEVREVVVTHMPRTERARECWAVRNTDGDPRYCSSVASALSTATQGLDVREILAPGEPTRAELVALLATARREGAEEMRERCDEALDLLERHYRATERNVKAPAEERGAAWERGAAIENAREALRALDAPGGAT